MTTSAVLLLALHALFLWHMRIDALELDVREHTALMDVSTGPVRFSSPRCTYKCHNVAHMQVAPECIVVASQVTPIVQLSRRSGLRAATATSRACECKCCCPPNLSHSQSLRLTRNRQTPQRHLGNAYNASTELNLHLNHQRPFFSSKTQSSSLSFEFSSTMRILPLVTLAAGAVWLIGPKHLPHVAHAMGRATGRAVVIV
jgi:hypothetical protein